jgi:glycosyltransferase involved in cell wall biosynthesis
MLGVSKMLKIAIYDGSRNRLNTGYGALSRGIIRALVLKGCEVYLQDSPVPFDKEVPYQAEISVLPSIKETKDFDSMDLVFQIGTPPSATKLPKHTLMYTQNALGDLIDDWIKPLHKVNGLIVPGEFDANVFRKYFDRVYTCPQYVDTNIFNYRPTYRKEGSSMFTFMFVGGYGYRKGTDLLVEAFCKAFKREDEVELIFYCVTGLETGFNHVLGIMQKYNPMARIKLFSSVHSPAWMSRFYNRADAFITLSRGEGWCMPFHEALLCGKPAIAPLSTAMGESIPDDIAKFVSVKEVEISSIKDGFGMGMKKFYGKPGNVLYEPNVEEAIVAMQDVKNNYEVYQKKAMRGRSYILDNYSLDKIGSNLMSIISDFLSKS